jgi:hypothetical protein
MEKPAHLKMECRDAAGNTPLIIAGVSNTLLVVYSLNSSVVQAVETVTLTQQ